MKDRRLHVVSVLVAALLFAAVSPLAAGVLTGNCVVGERPAATLLFPYFEVELTNPAGRTTLIAINNRNTVFPVLARVTLWTDWGVPTYGFTLFLASNDVQTINVRDLFTTGNSPTTGPGAAIFPGCNNSLGTNIAPALLRTAHTGQNTLGSCFGSGILGPNVATGYITVDASARCPVPNGGGSDSPGDAGYFTGAGAIAVTDNVLWGDWFLVTPDQAFATGNPAVHIQADPDFFGAGDYTFYGRYYGFNGTDRRRPLPSRYSVRFLAGGPFSGGTKLIVWRDTRSSATGARACGSNPPWFPLGEERIRAYNEAAALTDLGSTQIFDLATQRMDIGAVGQPYTFGFLDLDLDLTAGTPAQAWVGMEASASGLYSVGLSGTAMNDLCVVAP